jgi:hypothetical protein
MYEVMIWVQDGLITIPTTLIILSHSVGFTHLERHTYKRVTTSLKRNLRRIICYTPYSEPVWPKRRNMVRFWIIERLHESEMFCSVGFEGEDCSVSAAAYSIHLPDPSFRLPM